MSFKKITAVSVQIVLSIIISILSLFLFTKSIFYERYVGNLAHLIKKPLPFITNFDTQTIALIIPILITLILLINSLIKIDSDKSESSTRIFTGFLYLLVLLTVIYFSQYPLLNFWSDQPKIGLAYFQVFVISGSVLTIHLILKFLSGHNTLGHVLDSKGFQKDTIQRFKLISQGYTLLIGGLSLLFTLCIYFGSRLIKNRFQLYTSDPYHQIALFIVMIAVILILSYIFIDRLLIEK